jgi:hypothetical protein
MVSGTTHGFSEPAQPDRQGLNLDSSDIMNDSSLITTELDELHAQARAAFERRDLAQYRDLFEPGLAYRQADGRVIDRDRLMRDVDAQFRRLGWLRSRFVREHIEFDDNRATEILVQTASAGSTAFFVVHRVWELTRRGRYVWGKQSGRWQIQEVEVLQEQVSPGRFHVGFRADPSD